MLRGDVCYRETHAGRTHTTRVTVSATWRRVRVCGCLTFFADVGHSTCRVLVPTSWCAHLVDCSMSPQIRAWRSCRPGGGRRSAKWSPRAARRRRSKKELYGEWQSVKVLSGLLDVGVKR